MKVLDFLKELVNRLRAKNSKLFNVLQWIAAIAALVTGIPGLLEAWKVVLPEWATVLQSKVVSIASIVAFVLAQLDVDPAVIKAQAAARIAATSKKLLPFSE